MRKLNLPTGTLFVRARVEGVATIENGREFFLNPRAIEDGETFVPPTTLEMKHGDKQCITHWAGHHTPTRCQHCDSLMQYQVAGHDWSWMMGVFFCPKHPLEVWVDYYPKRNADTSQDTLNAWPQYADREKKIRMASGQELLRHQVIASEDKLQREQEQRQNDAPLLFKLTPEGLVPIHVDLKTRVSRWWQELLGSVLRPKLAS